MTTNKISEVILAGCNKDTYKGSASEQQNAFWYRQISDFLLNHIPKSFLLTHTPKLNPYYLAIQIKLKPTGKTEIRTKKCSITVSI